MKKRGQITLILIVALLLIVAFLITFSFVTKTKEKKTEQQIRQATEKKEEAKLIEKYIKGCFETAIKDTLWKTANYGFDIYNETGNVTTISGENYTFLVTPETDSYDGYCGKLVRLSGAKLKIQMTKYANEKIKKCINNFFTLEQYQAYDLEQGNLSLSLTLGLESTTFKIIYPIKVTKQNETIFSIREYEINMPVRLWKIHASIYRILVRALSNGWNASQIADPNNYKNLLWLEPGFVNITNQTIPGYETADLVIFTDKKSRIDNKPYYVRFLVANRECG